MSISTSQPMHKTCSGPSEKNFCRQFTTKPLITEILERRLLVAKKVPYNSQMTLHENCRLFVPHTDNLCFGPPTATYSNGHSSENTQCGIFLNVHWTESDRLAPSCKFLGQNFEYPALQTLSNFSIHPKISKSWHLMAHETANRWHIKKSKPRCLGHPRLMLDEISQCRVPSKLPQMCQKSGTFGFEAPPEPPSVSDPPKNGTTI